VAGFSDVDVSAADACDLFGYPPFLTAFPYLAEPW
jgi:hypothetical protein